MSEIAVIPTYADVASAAERLKGVAHRTPVMTSRTFDERVGARVFFKCENFQRIGAFKFRGAYNALSRLSDEQKSRGVLTFSSGNHAQAVALAGRLLHVPTTIVMPKDAPRIKLEATKGYGAEIVQYDRNETAREELGGQIASERGLTIVPPFNHPHVIAGQGTAAKELIEDAGELDVLIVCVGGGGLLSGCSLAARELSPRCRVVGAEPAGGDDVCRSFETGSIQRVEKPDTIADGARTNAPGDITFAVIKENVDEMVRIEDAALIELMGFFAERMKMVVEPTGCLAAAALTTGKIQADGARVGVVISGGNVDVGEWMKWVRG
ncbi:MAG: threo-3-hydroxy-L-aspartate ammonia-lyase [Planctomycetota bacterium]|nr:threo-3-hydroxy-L-aspartate ammonia-lyase [Planctomycetota bacterium]